MLRPLFISHCAEDHDVATRVCDHLESQGIACWIAPRDIPPGANFDAQIVDAIDGAIALVLLLSARANDSPFVKNEVNLAFSAGKPIFTVRVENVAPSRALHLYTATHQWINAFAPGGERSIDRLAKAVATLVSGPMSRGDTADTLATAQGPPLQPERPILAEPASTPAPPAAPESRSAMSSYFNKISGRLIYSDGGEQTFVGFRCYYSGRLYYSRSAEQLSASTYRSAPSIDLATLSKVEFGKHVNPHARSGRATFRSGKVIDSIFLYVEECKWWDDPGIEGALNDPMISAVIFHVG